MLKPIITSIIAELNLGEAIAALKASKVYVLMDTGTRKHVYAKIKPYLGKHLTLTIPRGEANKTLASCQTVWEWLLANHADRQAVLVVIGGGMLTDLGGFCAATYKRGIKCIYITTTLLG
jgi:3-dehydroquinate synthase